ncbi:hypothetical protein HanIR_Chr17g0895091 [Helianthus annuus]|nr:hypothetical protein HanIR_Chr17g0895091 [Helianthus annuus]
MRPGGLGHETKTILSPGKRGYHLHTFPSYWEQNLLFLPGYWETFWLITVYTDCN